MVFLQKSIYAALLFFCVAIVAPSANGSQQNIESTCFSLSQLFRLAAEKYEPSDELLGLLSSFNRNAWIAYAKDIAEWGYSVPVEKLQVIAAMHAMPPSLRKELLKIIGEMYRTASKTGKTKDWLNPASGIGYLPPKRAFDFWITELGHWREAILQTINSGRHPLDAWNDYLKSIQSDLGMPEIERYSANAVLDVARTLQNSIRRGDPIPAEGYIILGGSFVNGRARSQGSDIDAVISSPTLDRIASREPEFFKSPIVLEGYSKVIERLNQEVAQLTSSFSSLAIESKHENFFTHEDHARFFGGLQPISILVNKNTIILRVHLSHGNGWVEGGGEIKEFVIE